MYYDVNQERFLIASLLNSDNTAFAPLVDILQPEDFYVTNHQKLYRAMLEVYKSNTALTQLDHTAYMDVIGFVSEIIDGGISLVPENAIHYAESVKFYSNLRALDRLGTQIKSVVKTQDDDEISDAIGSLKKKLNEIAGEKVSNVQTIADGFKIYKSIFGVKNPVIIKTGITDIDIPSRGLIPGEVAEIMARPYIGKSLLAQNIQILNWIRYKLPSIYFSYEMSINSLTERALAIFLQKKYTEIEAMVKNKPQELEYALDKLKGIYFVEASGKTLDDIQNIVLANPSIKLIFIDYLGLILSTGKDRYNKISAIADGLKPLALNTNTVVIILSQINRSGGDGTIPVTLDMASDSTQVEAAADVVIGMWRNDMNKDLRVVNLLKARRGYTTDKEIILMFRNNSCSLVPVEMGKDNE